MDRGASQYSSLMDRGGNQSYSTTALSFQIMKFTSCAKLRQQQESKQRDIHTICFCSRRANTTSLAYSCLHHHRPPRWISTRKDAIANYVKRASGCTSSKTQRKRRSCAKSGLQSSSTDPSNKTLFTLSIELLSSMCRRLKFGLEMWTSETFFRTKYAFPLKNQCC